jgi:NADH pyrophosphatase NudC (nudix superfamily)
LALGAGKKKSLPMKYCPECASPLEVRRIDGLERKVCSAPDCSFTHWDNPVPVVAALVEVQEQIVLARNAKWPSDMFSLITGFLERGETPEQAVVREVKEELGLDGQISGFIGLYPFFPANQLILAFSVTATGIVQPSDEIAEVRLVSKQQIGNYEFGQLAITAEIVRAWWEKESAAIGAASAARR